MCISLDTPIFILEHDAVVIRDIDLSLICIGYHNQNIILSFGKPSFGKFKVPPIRDSFNPLTSKDYLPGAHAYVVSPSSARALLEKARDCAKPTDVFIHKDDFAILEYFPWPVEVQETFSTVQNKYGIKGKHQLNERYKLLGADGKEYRDPG